MLIFTQSLPILMLIPSKNCPHKKPLDWCLTKEVGTIALPSGHTILVITGYSQSVGQGWVSSEGLTREDEIFFQAPQLLAEFNSSHVVTLMA